MPLEGLEEEGLPKNPDLRLVQWKFQLTVGEEGEAEKEEIWGKLLGAIKENCRPPSSSPDTLYTCCIPA